MRLAAATAVLLAVLVGASPASGAVCQYDPQPRLTPEERRLRETIAKRKDWGLPYGRAFVRRVNADPAARRRGLELLDFPMTVREARYFRLRSDFQDGRHTGRLNAYLRRHRDVLGGSSIEDDYPRSPYILVYFTKDIARHRRAIDRLFALRFVVRRSQYTERELQRIQDSIDTDALEAEGIDVQSSFSEIDRVNLQVITARTDAADVVRRLYGPAVHVNVLAAEPTFLACFSPRTYSVAGDGRTVEVMYVDSGSVTPRHVEVVESATEVRLGIVSEVPWGGTDDDAVPYRLTVTLAEPLGDRVVRSIKSGRRIRVASGR